MSRIAHYTVHCDRCGKGFKVEGEMPSEVALSGHIVGAGGINYEFQYNDLCPKCQALVKKLYGKQKAKKSLEQKPKCLFEKENP